MKTGKFNVKHHAMVGPGGWKCTCCGPAPSARRVFARIFKRKTYRALDRELNKEHYAET